MPQAPPRRLRVEDVSSILVVSFLDSRILSEDVVQEVSDQLQGLLETARPTKLLLNFGNVRLMSSALLGGLIKLKRSVEATQGVLKLCCLPSELGPIFRWCRVEFATYVDEQDALDSF